MQADTQITTARLAMITNDTVACTPHPVHLASHTDFAYKDKLMISYRIFQMQLH
jgi:hypothetical protein